MIKLNLAMLALYSYVDLESSTGTSLDLDSY